MREYETMIVAKSDLPEAELSKMVTRWESVLTSSGGQLIKKDNWGIKRLAYPINKQSKGNYFVYDVASTQENVVELERILRLDENVLRSLVIKLQDHVDVDARRLELQKLAQEAAERAAESARERAEQESLAARRGGSSDEE